jgi:hypothetical protein
VLQVRPDEGWPFPPTRRSSSSRRYRDIFRLLFSFCIYNPTGFTTPPRHPRQHPRQRGPRILLGRVASAESAHAEASESRYIRLRERARQAVTRRTESRYSGRRIRVSAARPLVDRPIYRRSRASRAGERRPKFADRVAASGELMGQPRSLLRERD